jgi:TalC/MipB family fructose-6-phosphate aldolase
MRIYISSGDPATIENALATGYVYGVTTNPTVLRRDNTTARQVPELVHSAIQWGAQEVHLQAYSDSTDDILNEGRKLSSINPGRVVVRIPGTAEGFSAASHLVKEGIKVDITAVYTLRQVLVANTLGASYVTVYLGRMREMGLDGIAQITQMRNMIDRQMSNVKIIAGSIRDPILVDTMGVNGIQCVTVPNSVLERLLESPSTHYAVAEFRSDADAILDDTENIGD